MTWLSLRASMWLGPECCGDSCLCRGHTYLEDMAELGSVRYQVTLEPDSGQARGG